MKKILPQNEMQCGNAKERSVHPDFLLRGTTDGHVCGFLQRKAA
jgi:hypothetical protein